MAESSRSIAEIAYQVPPPRVTTSEDSSAVFIVHGMGQQVRFETLEQAAGVVHRAVRSREPVVLRRVLLGDSEVTRAEIEYEGEAGKRRSAHVYEFYWAPLTEGKVRLADVFAFLRKGAMAGIRTSLRGRFDRWMFGRWIHFPTRPTTTLAFLAALGVMLSLALANFVLAAAITLNLVTGSRSDWPSPALFSDLTIDLTLFLAAAGLAGVSLAVAGLLHRRLVAVPRAVTLLVWLPIWAAVSAAIAMGILLLFQLWVHRGGAAGPTWDPGRFAWLRGNLYEQLQTGQVVRLGLVWGGSLFVSYWVRKFLVQYVGDVAAYVSAHTVSRFDELRERIKTGACNLIRSIFAEPGKIAGTFAYGRVVVLGHSLGSVIAYDALNGLIRQDAIGEKGLNVTDRTALFLTFGSPLDKTAFIFRSQAPGRMDLREAAAATMQPMIESYAFRPKRWVNLYTPNDWICGSLEYYDDRDDPLCRERGIINVLDPEATTPLAAHGEYWSGSLLARHLREALR